jgi:hypothetical protein
VTGTQEALLKDETPFVIEAAPANPEPVQSTPPQDSQDQAA